MIEIIPATDQHIQFIQHAQLSMAMETEGLALDPEILLLGIQAVFDDKNRGKYYVALFNERIVACMLTLTEWSDWRNGDVVWIQSVYVLPESRRYGVFSQFYLYVKQLIKNDVNLKGIRLYVEQTNKKACAVYQAMGMSGEHYKLYEWLDDEK